MYLVSTVTKTLYYVFIKTNPREVTPVFVFPLQIFNARD